MRVRTLLITAATAVSGAAVALALGAGTAEAATPIAYPQVGALGVELNHGETQALADGPVPALIDHYIPGRNVSVGMRPDSQLPQRDNQIFASMRDIVGEAADKPDGNVDLILARGPLLVVIQNW
ncbi:hypothetical protein [Nocardia transvalensis]|uniref:hypothetical protein n=1 Tax=Nocardia transvalensis TaxID=37333 RepID=UPI00189476CD|nr:hypothetical protein [Nocardia transvalensis]MBF6331552.1 hypothetical protein [Nocardia transvalensis]